jgi:guanosine-3',5'-bis(diphosphate) 3'-pyrophosphohydrolase
MSESTYSIVQKAQDFATEKHKFQKRKNSAGDPYIVHPIEVKTMLEECGVIDEATLCGALLHDTVEDTGTSYDELVDVFGQEVADIVMECTDNKSLPKVERKRIQIVHAEHISEKAKLVKLGDKLSNISGLHADPPAKWTPEEIIGYVRWGWCVCQNLYGVNAMLDDRMKQVFKNFGVESVSEEQLNDYYKRICHSE